MASFPEGRLSMIERYYVRPDTVDRIKSSWIAAAVEQYVSWLAELHYSFRSISRRIPIVVRFGDFAQERGATKSDQLPNHIETFVEHWVSERAKGRKTQKQRDKIAQCVRNPVRQMLRIAIPGYEGLGRTKKPENPFADCAPGFCEYLRSEKGLSEATIRQYTHHLRRFASYLERIRLKDLKSVTPVVLSNFVTEYGQRIGWAQLRNACGTLRVFLRYLYRERILRKDISRTVEFPQHYRLSSIPRSITWDQVRQVLETVDRRTTSGKRDYAILLLLVTYGLRAHEVARLTLDDIDWRNERLRILERKASHSTAYPLSRAVGEAIVDYLKNGRPQTQDRRVFFRCPAPQLPIGSAAIVTRVCHYLRKAGINVPRPGSHTLRHTCVQRLVDADFPLKIIGDYVGHRSPSSTQIYSKVAIEALRQVAIGDGEEIL
jgi:integrase/recombinase XerD